MWDNFALRFDTVGYRILSKDDGIGIGVDVGARYHFYQHKRMTLFAEGTTGILYGSTPFPPEGTRFNLTYQAMVGSTYQVKDHTHLLGGLKFLHVSNGFVEGRDKNPATNTYGAFVGVMFTF